MPPASDRPFSPGFRLSVRDVSVIVFGGGVAAWAIGRTNGWAGVAVAFDVGHFFLFCTVVRMGRRSELAWAIVFVVGAAAAGGFGVVSWPAMFGGMMMLTVVLVAMETRRPSYHGVGWWWVNPGLPAWWAAHGGTA